MNLHTLDLEVSAVLDAANEAFRDGDIDKHSNPLKVLKEVLKRRQEWRGFCTVDGETAVFLGPGAWTAVPELSNTANAILHSDGSAFLPAVDPETFK